jgi:hypothetical protein
VSDPRKHHYVPRFYLANFSSLEGKKHRLWVYEKGREPRKSTPILEGCRKDFYAFVENGQRNIEVEVWLSTLEAAVVSSLRCKSALTIRGFKIGLKIQFDIF